MYGLRSKLIHPVFKAYLNEFDVIACSEIKLDELDEIIFENHQCVTKERERENKKMSINPGGIAILIMNNILK